ncbi:MAG: shikimate dehydrogenase [Rhodospirillales bacterium]|nr:shikimate dehydrogenase [Rhodospirillales bacterium]
MILSGRTRLAGVMGWPVAHSLSPRLHGYWLRQYGIDGAYVPLAVRPERLAVALRALSDLGFAGCNLTAPHKESALTVVDEVEQAALPTGAINTVRVRPDGTLFGWNTDIEGYVESLAAALPGWSLVGKPAAVLGAGGAARAVLVALAGLGAAEIRLVNRTSERAEALAKALGGPIRALPWGRLKEALGGAALLVNTTTLGMAGEPPLVIDLAPLPEEAVVSDIVYAPLETPLLAAARARGHRAVDGLGMLLHQAVPGFEAWFGTRPAVSPALRDFVLAEP